MTVASQNRRLRLQLGTALVGTLGMLPCSTLAQTLPQTPSVAVGTAAVTSNGTTMQVDIRNTNPVINWDSFNIGSGKTVNFVSTDGGAPPTADLATPYAVLNRVDHLTGINHSYTAATIDGTLSGQSNIAVWLVDPAGITFGSTGTFSGGSLVLSTLEVSNAEFTAGGSQSFLVALETDPHVTLNGGSSVITLTGGSGALTSAGSILILGEKVSIGKSVSATGPIGIVAADAVTFPSSAASPLSYNITAGTSLAGGGVHILGTGTLSGQSVTLAAVSVGTAIGSILQVDSGATLTATQDGGAIVLATKTDGGNTILLPNGDGIVVNGALATTGANGSVRAISAGGATVAGNVTTTGTGTYQVTGTSVTIGGAGTVTQTGASGITLTSTSGDVTGNTGATLTSGAAGTIAVTSAAAATIRSSVNAGNQYAVTGTSVIVGGTSQTATNLLKLNATGGSATTEAGLTLTSSTNNVQIDATAGLALNANSSAAGQYLPTASGGDVAIGGSSTQAGATGATITASTGNITAATGSAVNSSTGTVAFSAANGTAQVLSNVSAGNQYTVTAKSLEAGGTTQTAANLVWLKATAGSATTDAGLTLGSTTNNVQIDATTGLTLNGTITANQAFTATTAAGNITGNASITSDIAILGTNPIILDAPLGTINMGLTSSLNAGTSVVGLRYAAGSNVSLGNVSAGNIADYTPGAPPTFNSAPFGTNITDFTAGTVNVINALNIQVLGNIRMTAANSSSSTVGLRGLDITGTSGGSGTRSDTGFGRVAVSAAGGVSIAATGLAQGATVSTTSGNVVISGGNNLPPSNGSVDLSSVSAPLGAVTISAYSTSTTNPYDGDIIVGGIVAGSTVSVFNNAGTSGDITLSGTNSTTAANFTVNAIKQASVSGPVTINTTGSYSVTGSSVVLGNGTAMTQTAPNNITITANSGDLTLQNGLTLNATGVASSALTLASTTGAVLAGAGSVLKTTSGDVTINAANSATIASAVDSGGQYLITAGTGFEVGDTGGATVIQKAAGQIKLTTSAGTGKADAGLTLNSTGSDVILAAPGGLTLNANVTAASLYQATAPAGSITVGGNSTQSGNAGVTIVATGGNLTAGFGSTLTSSGGAVNLGATGGTATIDSAVSAGSDFLVRAGTINLATLATGPVTQTAVATVDIKSAIGAINGGTNLRLVSGTGGSVGFPTSTFLDSATLVNLALGSSVDATNSAFFITVPANQAVSLGDVHALFIATVDAAHTTTPLTLTGIGDFTAGTITASRLQLSSSGSIRLRALNTFASGFSANVQLVGVNVTGLPGASIGTSDTGVGRFDVSTANNLIVSANGLIQGGTLGAATMTLTGGNVSGSLANGSIDVGTITATTGLTATAYSTSAVDARTDGDIRIGRATVSAGSASLSNIAGGGTPVGDVVIADKLTASGNIGIDSANDVITAAYDAVADTGYVKSTGGTIAITAKRSVYAVGGSASASPTTASGFGQVEATGNLTVNATGDVQIASLSAGNNLSLNIAGALLGGGASAGPGTAISGGGLFANGVGGTVSVKAGQALLPTTEVITLNRIEATGNVDLWADKIAVGTLKSGGTLTLADPSGAPLASSNFYIGLRHFDGDAVVSFAGAPVITNVIATETISAGPSYGTEDFDAAFGHANLTATSGTITGSIGNGAQLGTVAAGGTIDLIAGGIVADSVTSSGANIKMTANTGTLSLLAANATTTLQLTKNGGASATPGDELRLVTGTSQSGLTLTSSTNLRVGSASTAAGALSLTAGADASGLRQFGKSTVLPLPIVTTGIVLSDHYGSANLTATAGSIGVTANSGGAQLGTLTAGTTITASAQGMTVQSATSGGTLSLTATQGTLYLGTGAAVGAATLTKQNGSILTDGDELRVGTITVENTAVSPLSGLTLSSATHVRVGTATNKYSFAALTVTATNGDVSGLKTGSFEALPTVTTGSALSANYGKANLTSTSVSTQVSAANGGAQIGLLSGPTASVTARAISIDSASGVSSVSLTATQGTLVAGSVAGGFSTSLTKQGGSIATAGDELRVTSVTSGSATLASSTHVRAGTVTSSGFSGLTITATNGDVTGLQTGSFAALPAVTTGTQLSANYGATNITITGSTSSNTISAANGGLQLGSVTANNVLTATGKAMTLASFTGGSLALTATQGTLYLGTGTTAGGIQSVTKQGGSANVDGDDLRIGSLTATSLTVASSTHVRLGSLSGTGGSMQITASGGDITGLKAGAFEILPTVTTATQLSTNYGKANIATSTANLFADSGAIQLGSASSAVTARARAITADTLSGSSANLTATQGTLAAGSVTEPFGITLTKQNGAVGSDGDDLRVASLDATGSSFDTTLTSSTSIRLGTIATTASFSATATAGDITGFKTGSFQALLPTVTTSTRFSSNYDLVNITNGSGSVALSAGNAVQFDTLAKGQVTVTANGITGNTATSGTGLNLTANAGTLYLGSGTATSSATLRKLGGSTATDGDELRVATLTAPAGITLASATALRVGTATAASGSISATATAGDISGFKSGSFVPLFPTTGGTTLSGNYDLATLTSGGSITATAGNGAQFATLSGTGGVTTSAKGLTVTTATTSNNLALTATSGTLAVGTATAGRAATLTKQGTDDVLRITSLIAGNSGAGNATLTSGGNARIGTVDSRNGTLTITAQGDVTGTSGSPGGLSDPSRGRAALSATGDLTVTATGLVQGGTLASTGGALAVTGGDATHNGSVDLTAATAFGNVALRATAKTPVTPPAYDGDILVGPITAGGTVTLDNTVNGGNAGLVQVSGAIGAGSDVTVASASAAQLLGNVTAGGNFTVTAAGDIVLGSSGITTTQKAAKALSFTSTGGSALQNGALVLQSDSDRSGSEALTVTATGGSIVLGNAQLIGGSTDGQEAPVVLAGAGTLDFGRVDAANLRVTAGGTVTAHDVIEAGNGTAAADVAAGPATVDLASSGGAVRLGSVTASGAGHGIRLVAGGGDVTGLSGLTSTASARPTLTAAGTVAITSSGTSQLDGVTAGGALSVFAGTAASGGAIDINSASAAGALELNALAVGTPVDADHDGGIRVATVSAGSALKLTSIQRGAGVGGITVRTSANAGSDATIDAAGAAQIASANAGNTLAVRAGTTVSGVSGGATLTAGEDLAIKAGGAVTIAGATAGDDLTISAPGPFTLGSLTTTGLGADTRVVDFSDAHAIAIGSPETLAGAQVLLSSSGGGDLTITGPVSSSGSLTFVSGAKATIAGPVTVGGNYTVNAAGDIVLGGSATTAQSAKGAVAITSSAGSVGQGAGLLTLTANTDGIGSEPLTITAAHDIAFANSSLTGGDGGRQSPITLTTTAGKVLVGTLSGSRFVVTTQNGFTASGDIVAGNAANGSDVAAGPATVDVVSTGGGITAGAITVSGAGHDIHLGTSGPVTTGALAAARAIVLNGGASGTSAGAFTAPSLTASAGTIELRASSVAVSGASTAGVDFSLVSTGPVLLGTGSAGGSLGISGTTLTATSLTSGAAMSLVTTGAIQLGSTSAGGALTITGGSLSVTGAANGGGAVSINTGSGAAQLGSTSAGTTLGISSGTIAVNGAAASGGAMTLDATGGALQLGSVSAGGDAALSAKSKATLGAVAASGRTVTLTAADADLNGALTAAKVVIVDRGASGNTLRLGDNALGSGGFQLSAAELNRIGAGAIVLDAGTGTGLTRQDVAIGTLALGNGAVRTFDVYALGTRIDITGNLTSSGTGLTGMRLGGTGTAADLAGVLRVAANADGTAGRIDVGNAVLDLRAASIGVGQDTGFLTPLGLTPGNATVQVTPQLMGSNPTSGLYNSAQAGGAVYAPAGQKLITAGSMTVRYSNFALFQNTATPGLNDGVNLATATSPAAPATVLIGPNPPDAGPFALFGQINGIRDTATPLLGPSVISVTAIDRTTARINGCLIGSGVGCLSASVLVPALPSEPVRGNPFRINNDFQVPFDPLVGTNNDTLFGDVGTFGLDSAPLAPIECDPKDKGSCPTPPVEEPKKP